MRKEVRSVRHGFERIGPKLLTLINERGNVDRERFSQDLGKRSSSPGSHNQPEYSRVDCDDLHVIDAEMDRAPLFRDLWAQYRMTLILEQVPWFVEPRIFSTKPAEEVFTQKALIGSRVNLSFYNQFPSLVTGIGLLLTFIALFIGLGKLHAEGSEIVGIQGLINGLAGKFLTSIVGLIAANMFTFIEKPMVSQLMSVHHSFVGLIDRLFPRKTMEQMLEQLTWIRNGQQATQATAAHRESGGDVKMTGLAGPMANLTSVIQSLTRLQEDEHAETRQTISELPRVMREELQAPLRELTDTIHDLTKALQETPTLRSPTESAFEQRPLLWKNAAEMMDPSAEIHSAKTKPWLRWPRLSNVGRHE